MGLVIDIWGGLMAPGDERQVRMRKAHPDDVPLLADLVYCVSARTRRLRYFQPFPPSLGHAWGEGRRMARQPAERALTLIATVPDGAMEIAVAAAELAYDSLGLSGELAVLVRDDYQGQGLGAALGRLLVALAQARGLAVASTLAAAAPQAAILGAQAGAAQAPGITSTPRPRAGCRTQVGWQKSV